MSSDVKVLDVLDKSVISAVVECLKAGGVVLMPTETVYGLMTLASNLEGRERIFEIKNRPANKLLQVLISSVPMAKEYGGVFTEGSEKVAEEFWPGGLTMVVDGPGEATTGFRLPDHELTLKVIQALGEPLAATSANISGEEPVKTVEEALSAFTVMPDLMVDGGECTAGVSSTLISALGEEPKCLREGGIAFEAIKCVWNLV